MAIYRLVETVINRLRVLPSNKNVSLSYRSATSTKHGVVLPRPPSTSFGIFKVVLTVTTGLLIGAGISKNIANFLEENDLFVPDDDDDDN